MFLMEPMAVKSKSIYDSETNRQTYYTFHIVLLTGPPREFMGSGANEECGAHIYY